MKPYNKRYLSHRPFLVIDTLYRPAQHIKTSKAGWGTESANWRVDEIPYVVNRLSKTVLDRATIVIDLLEDKVIKNRNFDPATVLQTYRTKYAGHVSEALRLYEATQFITKAEEETATPEAVK